MTSLLLHPIGMQDESMKGNLHKFVKFSLQIANFYESVLLRDTKDIY